ncbi:di-heme oxidoredictase family protein [Roseateles amylovorans]|uniref:C-type cytochrome n=1 Tax=Roseateles amylovorans TaxID=2978473 RepID=A0ABY6AXF5_9BURK|nr:di-heme oxidoredictase family protein [Roseateles amylovorans]UXH76536.1 c-type cytochrome [Roseateles amylovorans]
MKNKARTSGLGRAARDSAVVLTTALLLGACGGGKTSAGDGTTLPPVAVTPPDSGASAQTPGRLDADVPDVVPLFASNTPVTEQIQYTEADGTLVTLIGFRPTARHAREGGEEWTDPVDRGPGNYLAFPPFYFQNRTFGLVIRDEVPAGRQRITAYLKPNNGTLIDNSFNAFRRLDPGVIEYGWKLGVGFDHPKDGTRRCNPSEKIEELCIATQIITDYWRFDDDRQYQGITTRLDNKLRIGDKVEMTAGVFLDHLPGTAIALIDGGQSRDYSLEQMYVVGKGVVPWYGIAPKLDTTPLPDDALLGGLASVSYNYSEEPHRLFQQSVGNIGIANMQRFVEGRRLFHTSFQDGRHSENADVNPTFTAHAGQQGPRYNEVRCFACHQMNGRSPAAEIGARLNRFAVLTAAASTSAGITPDATYGLNVQQIASSADEPDRAVSISGYETTVRTLPDGEKIELRKPVYAFKGPTPAQYSVRQAMQVMGVGLLEAIDENTILAFADPDDRDADGVRGVPNWAVDPETGKRHLGRFGWKAGKASVRHQAAEAFLLDMAVTTPAFRNLSCQRGATDCKTATATPAVSAAELDRIASYLRLLGVPAQRKYASGYTDGTVTPPEHRITETDRTAIQRGSELFAQARCTACHRAELKTGGSHPFQELRHQTIRPFTDLLLHDMGAEMADGLTEGQASPSQWRTQPLWGLGSLKYVQKGTGFADASTVRYLHDGRARSLAEAVAWHGGEAAKSRSLFESMSKADRDAVFTFLESL